MVVGLWFGVDQDFVDFRALEFEAVFEGSDDFVDALHGELVGQGAVAGELDVFAAATYENLVDVEDFGEFVSGAQELPLDAMGFAFATTGFSAGEGALALDRGGLALDVGEDGPEFGNFAEELVFHSGNEIVGVGEGHVFVELDVLLDAHFALDGLNADVVDGDVVAGGDGANAVEDAFC